jgi:predicted S18 family serine protease
MLVTNAHSAGLVIPFSTHIGEGVRGVEVRRVDVTGGSADLRHSAERATRLAYDVLSREKYLSRQVVVSYRTGASAMNVHGRSAELAFALAFALAVRSGATKGEGGCLSIAATGLLGDDGAILPVEKLPEKVAAALNAEPPVSMILFPAGNAVDLPVELKQQAAARAARKAR